MVPSEPRPAISDSPSNSSSITQRRRQDSSSADVQDRLERRGAATPEHDSPAPGDFRTVRQSLFYYGGEVSNAQRLDALEREAETKNCGRFVAKRKIGF